MKKGPLSEAFPLGAGVVTIPPALPGGTGFADYTYVGAGGTSQTTHSTYTHFDITGEGILAHLGSYEEDFFIQADGGPIRRYDISNSTQMDVYMKFQNSLKVTSQTTTPGQYQHAIVYLWDGKDFDSIVPIRSHSDTAPSHLNYTYFNVTGAGLFMWIGYTISSAPPNETRVQVDGGPIMVFQYAASSSKHFLWPFKTSLIVTSDTSPNSVLSHGTVYLK